MHMFVLNVSGNVIGEGFGELSVATGSDEREPIGGNFNCFTLKQLHSLLISKAVEVWVILYKRP